MKFTHLITIKTDQRTIEKNSFSNTCLMKLRKKIKRIAKARFNESRFDSNKHKHLNSQLFKLNFKINDAFKLLQKSISYMDFFSFFLFF